MLPLATRIENHVKVNKTQLESGVKEDIYQEWRQRFVKEYEALFELSDIPLPIKKIEKETNKKFDAYVRQTLSYPLTGKLEVEQQQQFEQKRTELSDKKEEIKSLIKDSYQIKLKKKNDAKSTSTVISLENYIEAKIKEKEKEIEATVKSRLLSPRTPLSVLFSYAKHRAYRRAKENLAAAELFLQYGIPEKVFGQYLDLIPKDNATYIPDLFISGESISDNYKGYYLKKLPSSDPRAALLGHMTGCCQSINENGKSCVTYGITNERSGFYVLCKQQGKEPDSHDSIVSQSWAWLAEDGNLVLDSIETQLDFRKNTQLIMDFYIVLASQLLKVGIPAVLVGAGGETPQQLGLRRWARSNPINYRGYSDSHSQRLIAHKELQPLLYKTYSQLNTSLIPLIPVFEAQQLSMAAFLEWCDLYVINELNNLEELYPYLPSTVSQKEAAFKIKLVKDWNQLLDNIMADSESIEKVLLNIEQYEQYINSGIEHKGEQFLCWAVEKGQLELVKSIIAFYSNININFDDRKLLLEYAIFKKNLGEPEKQIIKLLIKHGADVNAKDIIFNQPMLAVAISTENEVAIQLLIEADANLVDQEVMRAAISILCSKIIKSNGDLKAVEKFFSSSLPQYFKELNDYHARIKAITILINVAINFNDSKVIKEAKKIGWDLTNLVINKPTVSNSFFQLRAKSSSRQQVEEISPENELFELCWDAQDMRRIKELLLIIKDINKQFNGKDTCLIRAAYKGHKELVRLLLEHQADKTITNKIGETAAESAGNASIKELIDNWDYKDECKMNLGL
ncbi:hypothetical protein LDG_5558 [Legionella drancourtii LLAP12]|uniref:Ankyrin repeat-containing protein n=1 Tax=Legionella drancourtii LLAP12 TaxID=658187 RepID=G9EK36_9GAMM|nr:hypothetical protein LDG_5558 [Legionella drancourtii LLAP12]